VTFAQKVLSAWTTLALAFILWAAVEQGVYYHSRYQRAVLILEHYESRVARLEFMNTIREDRYEQCAASVTEMQEWRRAVTVASRHGWPAANRYISQFPLDTPEDYAWLEERGTK